MSERKEDISVRISANYAQALADIQRFTGSVDKAFGALPKEVQNATNSVGKLTEQVGKTDAAFDALPKVVQNVGASIDKLTERIEKMGRNDGTDQLKKKLRQANDEASTLSKTFDKLASGGKAIGAAMAGWQAGKMVLAPQLEKMMSYETKLADLTNLANADKDVAGRLAAMPGLNKKIMGAIQGNGGDRDAGLAVYQKILDAGGFTQTQADVMAPTVMRGATATGAEALDISGVGIAAIKNMDFKDIDLPKIIGMSIQSANLGGFGLRDMAKSLPEQMGIASETLGMKGDTGFAQLLTANQASMLTSPDPNKAANNVVNLLGKMTAPDTAKDFKKHGIDIKKEMMDASAKGGNPFTSFMQSVDKVMAGDKEYQALNKKLGNSRSLGKEEKEIVQTKILEQQLALLRGAGIGTVLQDMQARAAFFGLKKMGVTEIDRQSKLVPQDTTRAFDTNFGVKKNTLEFSNQQRLNAQLNAQTDALSNLTPALKTYNDWVTKLADSHPLLVSAIEGGKVGVMTLGAGAGAASIVMALLTKNAGAASVALGGVAATGGGKNMVGGGPGGSGFKNAMKANAAMALLYGAYDVYDIASNDKLSSKDKKIGYTGAAGGLAGFLAGAAAGGALGSIIPGFGTVGGMVIGGGMGLAGNYFGTKAGTAAGEAMFGESKLATPEKVQKAWGELAKSNPIEAKLQLKIAFDDMGKPVVSQTNLTGTNFRLDTGPMMTH